MSTFRNLIRVSVAAMLAVGLAACGGGSTKPEPTAQEVCEAADGRWNTDGTCTSAAELAVERQHMEVSGAITAAKTAVDGLSATSTDAEVSAAETLIATAQTALDGANLVPAHQLNVLQRSLDAVGTTLATTKGAIADHRQMVADNQKLMADQRMAANSAIDAANTAVAGLSATSTDAEVQAAKDAIQAAKDAVTAATALSMADRDGLNDRITPIETMLASTESDITDHRLATGASDAVDAAHTAVAGLTAESTDEQVQAAKDAVQAAKDALDAANARSAVTAAQATMYSRRIAMAETTLASTEVAIAAHRKQVADNAETQRQADVADARSRAMQSYMDADADAMKAEAAAMAAEEAAPGSQGAMAARNAAAAARTAATAAKAAHDAIMDGMTKAEADAEAEKAATQAGNANSSYMTAKTAKAAADEQQRISDVEDATEAASDAAMAARTAATAARKSATDARMAANAANDAYMRAMAARTDSAEAKKQADAANAAATMAESAANTAEMAADAARAAHMGIDAEGSAADAEMAQDTAEMKQDEAETAQGTASTQYMMASTAKGEAETAAMTHVLSLFLAANGAHVMDLESTMNVDEKAAHVASVGTAMAMVAGAAAGNQAAGATNAATFTAGTAIVSAATWPGDTVDNPATEDTDEFSEGKLAINITVNGGTAIPFELRESRAATDLNMDGDTTDDGEGAYFQTARKIADLGVFQGYDMWEDDGTDVTTEGDLHTGDGARVIVFTNKKKGKDSVLAVAAVTAKSLTNAETGTANTVTDLGTKSGDTYTGVTFFEGTTTTDAGMAFTGTLTCPSGTVCSVETTVVADGPDTHAVTGYVFTGSRAARAGATAADATEDNDYLMFGLWLDESNDGATDTFGAFAVGGTGYAANVANVVTGTATYTGNAAGAHHKTGEGVNWFHGDAQLTANFGAIDTDAERGTDPAADTSPGTISGEISNIRVNGGPAMTDSIVLRQAALTDGQATFNGNARMGDGEIQDDDTVDYPYNGTWSGSFYGVPADDADTTDVNESHVVPMAAAGTFGVTKSEGTGDDMVVESFVGAFGAHLDQ